MIYIQRGSHFLALVWLIVGTLLLPQPPALGDLDIRFDYRYDTRGFFSGANIERRQILEAAAATFEERISSTPPSITPSGINRWTLSFDNPDTGTAVTLTNLHVPAGTMIVFVGARSISSDALAQAQFGYGYFGDSAWVKLFVGKDNSANFSPFGGAITFDESTPWFFDLTPDTLDSFPDKYDFFSVAIHEIGHLLGISRSSEAFAALSVEGKFFGPVSQSLYGGPIPMAENGSHWQQDVLFEGSPPAMTPTTSKNKRKSFSKLDFAALVDIGYELKLPVPLLITGVALEGGMITVTWHGGTAPYRLEGRSSSSDPWQPMGPSTFGRSLTLATSGDTGFFRVAEQSADFVWINPGTFVMGSPVTEEGRSPDEIQHTVTLTQGFWMSRHEVTQAEYEMVMGSSPAGLGGSNFNPSGIKGPNFPVSTVNWDEAVTYCQRLTDRERKAGRIAADQSYRLPTEAEWEYAARATATGSLYGELNAIAWHSGNSGSILHEVEGKQPNSWGLYDMLGNVWEWCADWYGDYSTGSVTDPSGPSSRTGRVRRGGGWGFNNAGWVRLANRRGITANGLMGFRPVLSINAVGTAGFVWVPSGTFLMGSPVSEADRDSDEVQHTVTLTQGYWMSDHEVTQAEYNAVMGSNPSNFRGLNLPVETVSWNDAVTYCQKLTERERAGGRITLQQAYRLPTEAEWEYAARAGTTGARHGELDAIAWHKGNSGSQTHPVKQKAANAWGLYDMMGNVWEWCSDLSGEYPTGSVTDPIGPGSGSYRVSRGCGWDYDARFVRSANRNGFVPGGRIYFLGFRPVLSSAPVVPVGMALIPAGPFQMGDDRVDYAVPVHTVMVSAFAMDKWEVSIELWESVRVWGNARGYDLVAGGSDGGKHPVHGVNWYDLVKWNNARSEKEGKVPAYYEDVAMTQVYRSGEKEPAGVKWNAGYRLPTEAEWEYAARGGVAGKLYPWGTDEISADLANYSASDKGKTMPIGSYGANGYELYDMAGNVWEWVWDSWGQYSMTAQTDPRGPSSGSYRMFRGGSWYNIAETCRVVIRGISLDPGYRSLRIGFRSVLPPGQP
jgi:formylglycine-generating enzyme required for sulfatase activity